MILEYVHHSSDYWSRFAEKVIFDGTAKTITVTPGTTILDLRSDVYSAWVWWTALRDNSKYLYAMRYSGLDPIGGGVFTGDIYFLINGWKLILDLTKIKVTGVLYSEDYATAYYDSNLTPQYPVTVAALVNSVTITQNVVTGDLSTINIPTASQNASALLDTPITTHTSTGTVGGAINDLKDEALGRWKLDPVTGTMTLYRQNGTELKVFNLTPTTQHVDAFLERVPV